MTGWINGIYSKYHCQEPVPSMTATGETDIVRCLKPAQLRKFRHDNVPLCDEHYEWFKRVTEGISDGEHR